jgi:hypothetical protein
MPAVNVSDWGSRKFFRSRVFQASQIDAVDSITIRRAADAKGAHTAVFAEIMLITHRIEQIFGEFRLTGKQTKRFRFHHSDPRTGS